MENSTLRLARALPVQTTNFLRGPVNAYWIYAIGIDLGDDRRVQIDVAEVDGIDPGRGSGNRFLVQGGIEG